MVQNAARQAQNDIGTPAHGAAVPVGPANAEGYAWPAIIPGLSWAAPNALSHPLYITHAVEQSADGSVPARGTTSYCSERVEPNHIVSYQGLMQVGQSLHTAGLRTS